MSSLKLHSPFPVTWITRPQQNSSCLDKYIHLWLWIVNFLSDESDNQNKFQVTVACCKGDRKRGWDDTPAEMLSTVRCCEDICVADNWVFNLLEVALYECTSIFSNWNASNKNERNYTTATKIGVQIILLEVNTPPSLSRVYIVSRHDPESWPWILHHVTGLCPACCPMRLLIGVLHFSDLVIICW